MPGHVETRDSFKVDNARLGIADSFQVVNPILDRVDFGMEPKVVLGHALREIDQTLVELSERASPLEQKVDELFGLQVHVGLLLKVFEVRVRVAELESVRAVKRDRSVEQPQEPLRPVAAPNVSQAEADRGGQIQTPEGLVVEECVLGVVGRELINGVLDRGRRRVERYVYSFVVHRLGQPKNGVHIGIAVNNALLNIAHLSLAAQIIVLMGLLNGRERVASRPNRRLTEMGVRIDYVRRALVKYQAVVEFVQAEILVYVDDGRVVVVGVVDVLGAVEHREQIAQVLSVVRVERS